MNWTIRQLASALDVPVGTLERWIRQGRIPVCREGDLCAFKQNTLERWATVHNLPFRPPHQGSSVAEEADPAPESLLAVLQRGGVIYDLEGDSPETVLGAAVPLIGGISDPEREELLHGLLERERMTSTGIGKGVAIPHPRSPLSGRLSEARITTCFLAHPIDFGSVDDRPVFVMFLMISPSIKVHLHLLSRLSFCVRNDAFVDFLRTTPSPEALWARISEFEHRLEPAGI